MGPRLQRKCSECEEEEVQRKEVPGSAAHSAPPAVMQVLGGGGGRPLDRQTRSYFEMQFGRDLGGVRVHTGQEASARAVHALAYTVASPAPSSRPAPAQSLAIRSSVLRASATSEVDNELARRSLERDTRSLWSSGRLRPKLTISQADDPAEKEADAIAEQVLRIHAEPVIRGRCGSCGRNEIRHAACEGEGEGEVRLQRRAPSGPFVATDSPAGDAALSLEGGELDKSGRPPAPGVNVGPSSVGEVLKQAGEPLDPSTRAFFEPRFNHDFSRVRVHTGSDAAASARAIGALAYTLGRDIVFAAAAPAIENPAGQRLWAHELAHTLQASSSTVRRAPEPGSHGAVGGCKVAGMSPEDSGTLAHHQVVTHEAVIAQMGRQLPTRSIPRGTKALLLTSCPDWDTGTGEPDLFLYRPFRVYMGEIKSINQPTEAALGYAHYALRINELVDRFGPQRCNDFARGSDETFDRNHLMAHASAGANAPNAVQPAPVSEEMVPATPVDAGPYPRTKGDGRHLYYENIRAGAVVYWCVDPEREKETTSDSAEQRTADPEQEEALTAEEQASYDLEYAFHCVVEGVLGEIVPNPSPCGMLLGLGLSLVPYVDQAADIRDTVAHVYWILWGGDSTAARWLSVAFTLIGYIPEVGSAIKGTSKLGEKALREAARKVDDWVGPEVRRIFAAENVSLILETLEPQRAKWTAEGIEFFIRQLEELSWRVEQASTLVGNLSRMTGVGGKELVTLIQREVARVDALIGEASTQLTPAFDDAFTRIAEALQALRRERVEPPTPAPPTGVPAPPVSATPPRQRRPAQQELFERR